MQTGWVKSTDPEEKEEEDILLLYGHMQTAKANKDLHYKICLV